MQRPGSTKGSSRHLIQTAVVPAGGGVFDVKIEKPGPMTH
jgi:hypothetical protein